MTKELARKEALQEMEMYQLGLDNLDLLPDEEQFDFPVEVSFSILQSECCIHVKIPYDTKAFGQYRRAMGKGWKAQNWCETHHSSSLSRHRSFILKKTSHPKLLSVCLAMNTNMNKSVCHIEQDGVKEVPVWKVVCE